MMMVLESWDTQLDVNYYIITLVTLSVSLAFVGVTVAIVVGMVLVRKRKKRLASFLRGSG